jgi:hypothetical protein
MNMQGHMMLLICVSVYMTKPPSFRWVELGDTDSATADFILEVPKTGE